jgi:hypothetical protein
MNRLDNIQRRLAAAKVADARGPLPYAFAATPVVEAMEALLPLLREFEDSCRFMEQTLDAGEGSVVPAAERRRAAHIALLAHLRSEP